MKFFVALIACILLTSAVFGAVCLRLIATPAMARTGAGPESRQDVFGYVFIENCGSETVTIPTWVPGRGDGNSGSASSAGATTIRYHFAFKTDDGTKLIPSEASFQAVRLAPGERTQLPTWHMDVLKDRVQQEVRSVDA
jgi:hypothetical protein